MLYVMLVGAYPFERPEDKHDNQKLQKMIQVGWADILPTATTTKQGRLCEGGRGGGLIEIDHLCVALALQINQRDVVSPKQEDD
jgi:hypothetical protein